MTDSRPATTPLRNLALAAASTLIFAGLVEGVARLIEPPPVQREEYLWDWKERFKDGEFYTLEKGEGYPPDEENNVEGLRDRTHPVETYPALTRVAVLGDSVAFGHGLEGREAFPQLLQQKAEKHYLMADVLNVALPGWSTRQERMAYERIVRKYKPRVVLLAVCLNDLAELQINLAKPPSPGLTWLFKRSALVRLAMGASRREIGAVEDLFKDPDSPPVQKAFALFFDEVRSLRREVEADGAAFIMVVFPFRFQLEANAPLPNVQERIGIFAATERVALLDFLPELRTQPDPTSLFLDYDHFNAAGQRRIAEWLAGTSTLAIANAPTGVGTLLGHSAFSEGLSPSEIPRIATEFEGAVDTDEARIHALMDHVQQVAPTEGARARLRQKMVLLAVDSPDPRTRFEAARAVFSMGRPTPASLPALIRGVQHDDPRVRAFATWTLGEMGPVAKEAVPALVALAREDGGAGKTGALTAIGKIGGDSPETIPLLLSELKHPKENRRYRAARTIGRMGPAAAPALAGLIEALKDPSPLVRLHVVRALGELGESGKSAVPALVEVMNKDADPEVRKEVAAALSRLPGR